MERRGAGRRTQGNARTWLGITGAAGWLLGAAVWVSQALPGAHLPSRWAYGIVIWLFAWGTTGVDAWMFSRSPQRSSRMLAVGVAIQYAARRGGVAKDGIDGDLIARRAVYRVCGRIAVAAWSAVALVHALDAAGVWPLRGVNFALFTLFGLAIASRCTVIRLVGPETMRAEETDSAAASAARLLAERDRPVPPMRQHQHQQSQRSRQHGQT